MSYASEVKKINACYSCTAHTRQHGLRRVGETVFCMRVVADTAYSRKRLAHPVDETTMYTSNPTPDPSPKRTRPNQPMVRI